MPIVRIDVQAGKSTAYKRAILRGVREAIAAALTVPGDRIMQRIIETPGEDIDTPDVKSDRLTIIEISMLPRSVELKEAVYRAISRELGFDPGIAVHDLIILINDPTAECFYLNGAMQCTVPARANAESGHSAEDDEVPQ